MILFYNIVYTLALVFIVPFEYVKRPRDLRRRWLSERFGNVGRGLNGGGPVVWIHAVSVGEVMAALPMIREMMKRGYTSIVLSTVTDTGRQVAMAKAPEGVNVIYLPFDLKRFVKKAVHTLSPDVFITMETELWPNLFLSMKDAGVPVFILNGRISDGSFKGYKKITFFLAELFEAVEAACVQTAQDADRLNKIGMAGHKIHITGNFKFDIHGAIRPPGWVDLLQGMNIIAGSTHEGEEDIIVDAYLRVRSRFGPVNLILAPRHPRRFMDVERLLRDKGLDYIKRSSLTDAAKEIRGAVVLVDTIGELAGLYSAADVCVIGGSFAPVGGHNLFEAAYWAKPVVCGPHMNNFPLISDFVRHDAVRITDSAGLYDIVSNLLGSPELREAMGANAHGVFSKNSGAVEKALKILRPFLDGTER